VTNLLNSRYFRSVSDCQPCCMLSREDMFGWVFAFLFSDLVHGENEERDHHLLASACRIKF
jgi:hypothetical protein